MIPGDVSTSNSIPCPHPSVPSFESPNTAQSQSFLTEELFPPYFTFESYAPTTSYLLLQIFYMERFSVTCLSSNSSTLFFFLSFRATLILFTSGPLCWAQTYPGYSSCAGAS